MVELITSQSLAVKYRPKHFDQVVEQDVIKQILLRQIKVGKVKRVLLFTGPAGCGKTTNARIFANDLESCKSNIIELNAANRNGVDDIRSLVIDNSKAKPLQGNFKIFILDEIHMATVQAQNALLKLLEEPPSYCIYILCTTDPQKIIPTILSRVYRYDFQKISMEGITNRLKYILEQEKQDEHGFDISFWQEDALKYIAKYSNGGMRDAITLLDKVLSYSNEVTINNVLNILGTTNYDIQFQLLEGLLYKNEEQVINVVEDVYKQGKDLKLFLKHFLTFLLDVNKYLILRNFDYIGIPNTYVERLNKLNSTHRDYIKDLLSKLLNMNSEIRWETNPKTVIESFFLLEVL